jgi:4-hydroxy-tetrahydrodipicolinate synthase
MSQNNGLNAQIKGPIEGVWTAIATPFGDNQSIDWTAFDKLLEVQSKGQVSGVVISGTTGESPTLTVQEKISLVRKARAQLPPSIRVMAGSGGNNTSQSIELSKLCVDAGADSLLIVTPPYNKPSPAGMKLHYQMISEATNAPLCLYHVPGRTGQLLNAAAISAVTNSVERVQAVKEASGDLALFSRTVNLSKASILTGDDPTYLASLSVGGRGVISVISNVYPRAMVELTKAFKDNKMNRALDIHKALMPMIDILFCESNPGPLKAAIEIAGWAKNILRAPMAPVTIENYQAIKDCMNKTETQLRSLDAI